MGISKRIAASVFLAVFCSMIFTPLVLADQAQAESAIIATRTKIVTCYNAVQSAEASGANVSDLANVMTQSGAALSSAEHEFATGNFDEATSLAENSYALLDGVVSQANELKQAAEQQQNSIDLGVMISVAATIAVIVCSSVIWILLDRRSKRKVK